ncbi:galactinol--sucrose galactosyltransferase [Salix suchowensis]|nr:galactinol--sucrose galactosyltransferase [Salix suchowensis]
MFHTLSTTPLNLNMNMTSMALLTRPQKPNSCFSSSSSSTTFLPHCNIQSLRFLPHRSLLRPNKNNCYKWKHSMFISTKPLLKNGTLTLNGHEAITGVPDNVFLTPLTDSSAFLGATSSQSSSRHVFKLGVIQDVRLLSLFRFKVWWMIPRVGNSGSDIPIETQMLLLEARKGPDLDKPNDPPSYMVFLPLLDGEFRGSLQGNSSNELELCLESGDPAVVTSESIRAVFVNYGKHPFDLMKESMKILEEQTGTFSVRETKQMPGILDVFGWCTWDAFYHEVNPQGIKDGLRSLSEGGTPAKFLIIDDGWQDTTNEFQKEGEPFIDGSQFGGRLVSVEENSKFRRTSKESQDDAPNDLKHFVADIKRNFGLKYVYVWHALLGYWGGLVPNARDTKKYNPKLTYPQQSPGNLANMRDLAMDCMEKYGVGAIDPDRISQFYDDLHSYLVSQDVDGVKVDVQNILETIATDLGGRVSLTRHFQEALEKSIASNFQENSIICCMGLSTDSIYHSKRSAITRASDDYYPQNPATQTLHIAAVAFNSIYLGEVVVPDWDMFYSLHDAAEFHAIARAVGGCPVYVSDKPGHHDHKILKRLVLPDGSVLRAKYPGRPSRDCLFTDPVMDGKSLLKIWNLNKCTGVIGVFNCQGKGSWPCLDNTNQNHSSNGAEVSGQVSPADVEYFEEVSGKLWTGDCAIYSFNKGSVSRIPKGEQFGVGLKTLECDVFTVSPIKAYYQKIEFAPIGLMNMYNGGGAIESVQQSGDSTGYKRRILIKGRGAGSFGGYSSVKPKGCSINGKEEEEVKYREEDKLVTVTIDVSDNSGWDVDIWY